MNDNDGRRPSKSGALGWLPDSQRAAAVGVDTWSAFEDHLSLVLENLRDGQFVVCNVITATTENRKYLQFLVVESDSKRTLTAEASAIQFQGVPDANYRAQEALIDSLGWSREEGPNHGRDYPWPQSIAEAVQDSVCILRDYWAITHPSQVSFSQVQSLLGAPLDSAMSPQDVIRTIELWLASSPLAATVEGEGPDATVTVRWEGSEYAVHLLTDADSVQVTLDIAEISWSASTALALMEMMTELNLPGCPIAEGDAPHRRSLRVRADLPKSGLTEEVFTRHLYRLLSSHEEFREQVARGGLVSGD